MFVVLSRLALRSSRRLLKGLVSGVGLALALAMGSPLLAGIGVTLPTLGSAMAACPGSTYASSWAYGPAYTRTGTIQVTFSATSGTTGCKMTYSVISVGGLYTSWGDYHYDNYNPAFGPPNPPSRYPSGVPFNLHPAAQGVVHWYYSYTECARHTVPDKSWVAGALNQVNTDNGPCSGFTLHNIGFDDHTVIYDSVAPASAASNNGTYITTRAVPVSWSATDATSGLNSVSVYMSRTATVDSGETLCGTTSAGGAASRSGSITCNTTADGTWYFRSAAADRAGNTEAAPASYDTSIVVDTVPPTMGSFSVPAASPAYTADTTPTFTWSAGSDATSGMSYYGYVLQRAPLSSVGVCSGTWTNIVGEASNGLTLSWTTPTEAAGYCYQLAVRSHDRAGLVSAYVYSHPYLVDTVPPTWNDTPPALQFTNLTSWTFNWTAATDATSGLDPAPYHVVLQSAPITGVGVCGSWANFAGGDLGWITTNSYTKSGLTAGLCWRYAVQTRDKAGNATSGYPAVEPIMIDTVAPVIPDRVAVGTAGSNGWFKSPGPVTVPAITPTDAASGVASTTGCGSQTSVGDTASTAWTCTATDRAGNTASKTVTFKLDTVAPTSALNPTGLAGLNGWWRSAVTATPTGTDDTSGIWTVYYRVDGGDWTNTTASPVVVISVDGTYTVDWYALDLAGNQQTTQTQTIKIDTIAPTGDLTFDYTSGVPHSRSINASVTMADANSGPWQVRFSTDGGFIWTDWTAYVVTPTITPLTLASGAGPYPVWAQIQDRAGNMSRLNEVTPPRFGAAANIYDCTTKALLATNTTGTIYWPVDLDLCLVPIARLVTSGLDGTTAPPLVGTISDPSPIVPYTLHAADKDEMDKAPVKWPNTGFYPVGSDPLRFTFGRETSSLSTSIPYITVPYDAELTVDWHDGATLIRSEKVTVTLNLRIVVKNIGTTGTH